MVMHMTFNHNYVGSTPTDPIIIKFSLVRNMHLG